MGYDASVIIIFGSKIPDDSFEFYRLFLSDHPNAKAQFDDEYDGDEDCFEEFFVNFDILEDGHDLIVCDDGVFVSSFYHDHSVLRYKDPVKKVNLPSISERKKTVELCKKYKLSRPEFMTIVVDG